MKLSAKGRYGLAAMTYLAQHYECSSPITTINISEHLGISKIYLEQVFSLLKRARLVTSLKGSQGGYHLARRPSEISAYDILSCIELTLMEKSAPATPEKLPELDDVLKNEVYDKLDQNIKESLEAISLESLKDALDNATENIQPMYFI